MVIVTGGAGFIGSAVLWRLNQAGMDDIIVVDNLNQSDKWKNLVNRRFGDYIHKSAFLERLERNAFKNIQGIVHMGACSATTEKDADFLMENNYHYSRRLAEYAITHGIRMVNASSAATYGDGSQGFTDSDANTLTLKPMNMYGYSKHLFDLWMLRSKHADRLASLKFFNVFGPNEYHKQDMSSVVLKAFDQIRRTGQIRLFKSYHRAYANGEQMRDFVYVKDCVELVFWLLENPQVNGIFNMGTGRARTWKDLAAATFAAMDRPVRIEYVDMPETLRKHYQYHTRADMEKLAGSGYTRPFTDLEQAVADYVRNYLAQEDPYL
jgi:ADP-L-glycero-D-manno-heptose 6-epimerase